MSRGVQRPDPDDAHRRRGQRRAAPAGAGDRRGEGAGRRALAVARSRSADRPRPSHGHGCGARRDAAAIGLPLTRASSVWRRWTSPPPPLGRRCSRSRARPTCARCSPTIPQRSLRYRLQAGDLLIDYSKHLIDDDVVRSAAGGRRGGGVEARRDGDVRRREDQRHRAARRAAHRAACARATRWSMVDGHDVVPDVHEVLGRMADFADRVRSGAWRGATGEAMQHRRQHRHRWQRPRPGDGLPGDRGVRRARPAMPLRQQRRRRRHHRQPRRSRPGDDALRRQLEDVHHRSRRSPTRARRAAG